MWFARSVVAFVALFSLQHVSASSFLRKVPDAALDIFQEVSILDQLEEALGTSHREAMEARVWSFSKDLSSLFRALPKNERGAVSATSARYAIHRLFVQRHHWQLKMWSSSSPVSAVSDRLSGSVRDIFEERLGARGFDLHELAVLAATLEKSIHGDIVRHLETTYTVLGKSVDRRLDKVSVFGIIDAYMAAWVSNADIANMSQKQVDDMVVNTGRWYGWAMLQALARSVQRDVSGKNITLGFLDVTRIVEVVSEGFGSSLSSKCDALRDSLLQLEDGNGSGRVKLSKFHASTFNESWDFVETADYFRHIGAMDDSNPSEPRVIIPNYIDTPMNCLAHSRYYSVCCHNPCEGIMARLEGELRAPHASPEAIIDSVSTSPSESASSNRTVSTVLANKLNEIAQHHGGQIPLHGRLFAQWMHFVFPRTCPYPHVSNSTSNSNAQEYTSRTGKNPRHTEAELNRMAVSFKKAEALAPSPAAVEEDSEASLCSAMWEPVEELVDPVHGAAKLVKREEASSIRVCLRIVAMVVLVISMCAVLKEFLSDALVVATRDAKALARAGVSLGMP